MEDIFWVHGPISLEEPKKTGCILRHKKKKGENTACVCYLLAVFPRPTSSIGLHRVALLTAPIVNHTGKPGWFIDCTCYDVRVGNDRVVCTVQALGPVFLLCNAVEARPEYYCWIHLFFTCLRCGFITTDKNVGALFCKPHTRARHVPSPHVTFARTSKPLP